MNPQPKAKRWHKKKYEDWIKTQSCMICGKPAEPHHIKGIGNFSGSGLKADSILCMPLCHEHHMEMHRNTEMQKDQYELICRTVLAAVREGVLKL